MKRRTDILNRRSGPTEKRGDISNPVSLVKVDTRRGRIPEDPIHQVPDHELVSVANGSPESWYFGLALALLFLPVGFVVSLLTTTMSLSLQIFFTAISAASFGSGISLGLVWIRRREWTPKLLAKIRARLD